MMYQKSDIKHLQVVLTDKEKQEMQVAVQRSGMKQKFWLRNLIISEIRANTVEASK